MMNKTLAIIGVPSSAGAHWPGQEKAPQYLREAGLISQLESAGFDVIDYGNLPTVRFQPDKKHRHQQNLAAVVEVAQRVSEQVDLALQSQTLPLVIGGDCTIGLGVLAGFLHHGEDIGLLYLDGHVDLNTPTTSPSGILDSMGIAHMLGESGSADKLSRIGLRFPLIPEDKVVLFGYNPREMNTSEKEVLARRQIKHYSISNMKNRLKEVATEAVKFLESRVNKFIVHFDVDVIDFTDLPVADISQFSEGLKFNDVIECLQVFFASPKFGGLTITEFNPDHTDDNGLNTMTFILGLVQALDYNKSITI